MTEENNIEGSKKPQAESGKPGYSESKKDKNEQPETKLPVTGNQLQEKKSQPEPQSENMEVHKHPHDVTHKKKWAEYLLEFLMIFLAVFLGFVAENWREHIVEHRRERGYILSLIEDLKTDTGKIRVYISRRIIKQNMMDSLADLLPGKEKESGNEIYYFARFVTVTFPLITSDGTLQQLKNSGGLTLIRKQNVVDSIIAYDNAVKYIQYVDDKIQPIETTFREIASDVFDTRFFKYDYSNIQVRPVGNPQLITNNPAVLNKISLQVRYEANFIERNIVNARILNLRAIHLIELLKKEYHLE